MSRKILLYTFTVSYRLNFTRYVARHKMNAEATHELFKIKPPTIFHIFQFHIRPTQQKSTSSAKFLLGHHSSSFIQNQPHSKIREEYHSTTHYHTRCVSTIHETHIPIQRKLLQIMKITVSWKRFNNKLEGDFEEQSLFED